jgi:hypothetical protein
MGPERAERCQRVRATRPQEGVEGLVAASEVLLMGEAAQPGRFGTAFLREPGSSA